MLRTFLWCAYLHYFGHAAQYVPIEGVDGNDCAVVLEGSKHFIYNSGQGPPQRSSAHMCITYDTVNRVFLDVQNNHKLTETNEILGPLHFAKLGEMLLDVSQVLAKMFDLNADDVNKFLPMIDTSKTLIRNVCPSCLSRVACKAGKYRRPDGLCNNIAHPNWGSTMSTFNRLMAPRYSDKVSAPKVAASGDPLPLARVVSKTVHPDDGRHEHAGTVMLVAWGQFMDHDLTLTATPLDPVNRNEPEECCDRPEHLKNKYCYEIKIPEDDNFYRSHNVKCQDFVRSYPGVQPDCRLGPKAPFNVLTPVIDGNTIYGADEATSRYLRSGITGQLRMNPAFADLGLKELLPMKLNVPDEGCIRSNSSQYCFESGEIRVNEQLVLTCIHTLMAREHNRVAKELSQINPHWNDEMLYQEAKRIVVAEIQHITFNEFLPILLGKNLMDKHGLTTQKQGFWDGYDPDANPNILASFSAAAFRFGHSLLPNTIERWSKAHGFIASKRLSDLIRRPFDLYRAGAIDEYFMGLMNQVAQAMDDSITREVTNNLIKKPGKGFGFDLVSFNVQRGRDFGLPGYMEFRRHCGLPVANRFEEMTGFMPNATIQRYQMVYASPFDIDLWSGGVSENSAAGSVIGPTFACIIASQFGQLKKGDRFWYELPNQQSSFTRDQLQEIRNVKMSRLVCDNTDIIDTVQMYPMVLPDHELNPRVPCRSGLIPRMDLTKWADPTLDTTAPNVRHTNVLNNLKTGMTEAQILLCEKCNTTMPGLTDTAGTRVITIIDADENTDSNTVYGDTTRVKRGIEAASLANATAGDDRLDLPGEMAKPSNKPKDVPIKREANADMTQAIMEPRLDYDSDEEYRPNVPFYDGHRLTPATSNHHGYYDGQQNEAAEEDHEDETDDDGDHNSHYEYVPMEVDDEGNHRPLTLPKFIDADRPSSRPSSRPKHRGKPDYNSYSSYNSNPHEHDFKPSRGTHSMGRPYSPSYSAAPYSSAGIGHDYSSLSSSKPYSGPKSYDDYLDPSGGGGPKSFMTVGNYEDSSDGGDVISIDHGEAYESSKTSPSERSGSRYTREDDPLHPLRDYHKTGHDNEEMYSRLRDEYRSRSKPKGSSFDDGDDQNEPSSSSVNYRATPEKKKNNAYWRMSFVQSV
ncbi:peroxidase-like isoform X2 [Adelges cooleyi]|uniref:peroxidase-like isoform X2 n=1 Tax=Adelges cooleyi TaxID=133065 RepID=UPI00217F6025|nr:peroxidase-like isoform X2 [Adelges cooleyi]